MKNKKSISMALVLAMVISVLCGFGMTTSAADAVQYYVAVDGSDSNDGSISAPFATLEAARNAARKASGDVFVNIRGGVYSVKETLELDSQDNNTTYRAYKDEKVIFNAANVLKSSEFKSISAESKALIIDQKAADKVVMIDLKAQGITEYGSNKCIGMGAYRDTGFPAAVYFNDKRMTIARYPNTDYVETGSVLVPGEKGTDKGFTINTDSTTSSRMKKWTASKDLWVFGYFCHDWAEAHLPISIDAAKGTITSGWASNYGVVEERRYYFYNLLEELDAPGEWYLDRESGVLYLYPTESMSADTVVEFVTFDKPFISVKNAENIQIKNIYLQKGIGTGIEAVDVKQFVVDGCELASISDTGIVIKQSDDTGKTATTFDSGVKNSYIHDMGAGGVHITAGSRITLTPGNCFVTNNHIERFSQIKTTYTAGAAIYGVGNKVDHNEINDAPHFAIQYGGNEQIMEYNNLYRVCTDTADSGAIYIGRDWTTRGNKIQYNYFHQMQIIGTKTGMKVQAVYLDDMHSATEVNGNVFYKVSSVALFGGGRYNTFINNLMLECDDAFRFDSRGTTWMGSGEGSQIRNNLLKMPYKEGVWAEKYPELVNILNDEPELPKHNTISGNVIYRTPDMNLDQNVINYSKVENNITINNTKAFKDYAKQDFSLVADGEILKKIPDFEIIDYSKIGRFEVTNDDVFEEEGQITDPDDGSIKVLINGKKLNFADQKPVKIDNRTLVPLRAIFEALGATVEWDEATQTVTSEKDGIVIKLTIGSKQLFVNDKVVELDVEARVLNDRTVVPVRAIAESFGSTVGWDEETQTVSIDD